MLNAKHCEPISNKSILNASTSNEANKENNVLKNLRFKNSDKVMILKKSLSFSVKWFEKEEVYSILQGRYPF